jgi:hypothetical protein
MGGVETEKFGVRGFPRNIAAIAVAVFQRFIGRSAFPVAIAVAVVSL